MVAYIREAESLRTLQIHLESKSQRPSKIPLNCEPINIPLCKFLSENMFDTKDAFPILNAT